MQLTRKKQKSLLLSLIYKTMFNPLTGRIALKSKFEFFLYLTWIFDRLAYNASYQYYQALHHPGRQLTSEFLLPHIDESFSVLDLGCGYGHYSSLIGGKARKVVGVDYNKTYIEMANAKYRSSNVEFHCDDALRFLERSEERFDVLVLAHVLEHLDHPEEFLRSFSSHFNYIYIEVPDFHKDQLQIFRKDLHTPYIYTDEDHVSEFERTELRQILLNCGLSIIDERYFAGNQYLWLETGSNRA